VGHGRLHLDHPPKGVFDLMKIVGVPAGDGVGPVVGKVPAFTFPPSRMSTNPDLAVKGKSAVEVAVYDLGWVCSARA